MRVGYVRTSKKDQNPDLQRRELEDFGCEKVFEEQVSSRKADRPELHAALDYCREGDELVVWKLDRFGRSLKELIGEHKKARAHGPKTPHDMYVTIPVNECCPGNFMLSAYTYGLHVNRLLGRPQGRIKELWA